MNGESGATAEGGGEGVCGRFFAGKARAVRRNSMKEDLPELLAPMMRMLFASVMRAKVISCGDGSLEGSGVFPPAHATRAVDANGADGAACVAVAAAVGHALGARVRVVVHVRGCRTVGHGGYRDGDVCGGRHPLMIHRRPAEVLALAVIAGSVGDNGNGIGSCVVSTKMVNLG